MRLIMKASHKDFRFCSIDEPNSLLDGVLKAIRQEYSSQYFLVRINLNTSNMKSNL